MVTKDRLHTNGGYLLTSIHKKTIEIPFFGLKRKYTVNPRLFCIYVAVSFALG